MAGLRCWLGIVCGVLLAAPAANAQALAARMPREKPARTRLAPYDDASRIVLKFAEGSALRDVAAAERALRLAGLPPRRLRRLFAPAESELDARRERGQRRSRRVLADLNLYYELEVPAALDAAALCDALNALPAVELALPARLPLPPPVDLPPATPYFVWDQGYRAAAPQGIDADGVASIAGARGAGIALVDVEYQWVLDHEDLELPPAANIDAATLSDPFPEDEGSHGTAALGMLGGRSNSYGVTGLATDSALFVAPANTVQHGYDVGRAVNLAAALLDPGDVILLEQQTWVCGGPLGPVEWYPPWFDAIADATAQGIVVVEAGGNGGQDLDDPSCGDWFDRSVRDSGAILVGAGDPSTHARLGFSSYGSRMDVQGWGQWVTTTGYGPLFGPDVRQRYTSHFSGTSSAAPIVAGAALAVQGARLARGQAPLDPLALRALLVSTGTPQSGAGQIGPLPDLRRAFAALGIQPPPAPGPPPGCGLTGLECLPLLWLIRKLRRPRLD